ncbi:MAG: hypothetical protein EBV03_03960 [Proteobacteria bacterium]|nr:hypothetical protein [Pseudomonadota bacterium]
MKPVAFFLDSRGAREAQASLEARDIPSTIVATPLKENEQDGASGYRLLVEELYMDEAEAVLQGRQMAFMQQVQELLRQREEQAVRRAMDEAKQNLLQGRFWYGLAFGVGLAIVAFSLLR